MKIKTLILVTIAFLLIPSLALAGGGGGGGGKMTKYFSIIIEPSKSIYFPGEEMVLKIKIIDKATNQPVEGAEVIDEIAVYKGTSTKLKAEEQGNGIYIVKLKIDSNAKWGGVTNKITVSKDGKVDEITRVVTFMEFNPYIYAIGVTIFAILAGVIIGTVFGKTAAH